MSHHRGLSHKCQSGSNYGTRVLLTPNSSQVEKDDLFELPLDISPPEMMPHLHDTPQKGKLSFIWPRLCGGARQG